MKALIIVLLSLFLSFLSGCENGYYHRPPAEFTEQTTLPELTEQAFNPEPLYIQTPAANNYSYVQPPDYLYDTPQVISEYESPADFEVYKIMGTAESLTGTRWDNMLAWRANASDLARQHRSLIYVNKNPAVNAVYLTFDDGPDPVNTVSVINTLLEYNVSATFFFTGENIRRHGDIVKKVYDSGFAIGLHGYSHISFKDLSRDEIIAELTETNDLLEAITGRRSVIMRPPFGAIGGREISVIEEQDLLIYLWSIDTLDWTQNTEQDILHNIKNHLRPGDIILMHAFAGQAKSPAVLPEIIEFILTMGYEVRALPWY